MTTASEIVGVKSDEFCLQYKFMPNRVRIVLCVRKKVVIHVISHLRDETVWGIGRVLSAGASLSEPPPPVVTLQQLQPSVRPD